MEGPRALKKGELRSAIELANSVFRKDSAYKMEDEFPLLFSESNLENLRAFVDAGKVVSLVGMSVNDVIIMGCKTRVVCIGSVCTHPEYRNKGLASKLMEDAANKAVQDGASLMLVSGDRGLYRRFGCVNAGIYRWYSVKRSQLNAPGGGFVIRKYREEDVFDIVKLHQLEPVRFVRTYDDFKALLEAKRLCDQISETYVALRNGQVVAYVCLQLPRSRDLPLAILEYGGSRFSIFKTLGDLMDEVGTESAIVRTTSAEVELDHLMVCAGAKRSAGDFMGTVKLIDVGRFLEDVDGYVTEVVGERRRRDLSIRYEQSSQCLSFEYMDRRLKIEGADNITAFAFGSVEKRQQPQTRKSELENLLDAIFPMPLVDYGLNYV
ncbi:MAG: GNAT family N-acetyltransferase [Candidatus Brockarchaeota archaeon]|nr:GNAT family N-acetyltransferase [Candidatus Brockarchaeota archaeon]